VKSLIIAEKPNVGRAIATALLGERPTAIREGGFLGHAGDGEEIVVAWAEGHLLEIPTPDEIRPEWGSPWRLEVLPMIPETRAFPLVPKPGAGGRLGVLRAWAEAADEVVNACDAGPEGELIFAEILQHWKWNIDMPPVKKSVSRMWIMGTTPRALRDAWDRRAPARFVKFQRMREASWARREGDWLWGYNLTRYATLGVGQGMTVAVGRVQTPVLGEVVRAFRDHAAWEKTPFYMLDMVFRTMDGKKLEFVANLVAQEKLRPGTGLQATGRGTVRFNHDIQFRYFEDVRALRVEVLSDRAQPWAVVDQGEDTESWQSPPPSFSLVELQRTAFRLWGWSAKRTLFLAQRLYAREHAISYPRTESEALPTSMTADVLARRKKLYQEWALVAFPRLKGLGEDIPIFDSTAYFDNLKVGDHYGIIPTGEIPPFGEQADVETNDARRLWELIAARFMLSWLPPAKIHKVKRALLHQYWKQEVLRAQVDAEPVIEPGWLSWEDCMFNTKGFGRKLADRLEEKALPPCPGGTAALISAEVRIGQTTRPEPHDEETLLGYMVKKRLGTAATRAEIIDDLCYRLEYILRHTNGNLVPTPAGARVVGLLETATGQDLVTSKQAEFTEAYLERIMSMARARPTRAGFWTMIEARIGEVGAKLAGRPPGEQIAFCPRLGTPPKVTDDGKAWIFGGFPEVICRMVYLGRHMKATDYEAILGSEGKGAGPFEGFISRRTGKKFDGGLIWVPREKRFKFFYPKRRRL
jgi:DNA topoisomerase-3